MQDSMRLGHGYLKCVLCIQNRIAVGMIPSAQVSEREEVAATSTAFGKSSVKPCISPVLPAKSHQWQTVCTVGHTSSSDPYCSWSLALDQHC